MKELLRRAALRAADETGAEDGPIRVTDAHLAAALNQLLDASSQLTRVLLGGGRSRPTPASPPGQTGRAGHGGQAAPETY